MFVTRLISGIILVIGLIAVFVFGDPYLTIVFGLLSLIADFELMRVVGLEKKPVGFVTYLSVIVFYVMIATDMTSYFFPFFVGYLLLLLFIYVIQYPKVRIEAVSECFFAVAYAGFLLSHVVFARNLPNGQWLVWLIVFGSWGADTCAYCVGKLIGKHHFSELSPKKTIEGCVGGVLGAGLLSFIYSLFVPDMTWLSIPQTIVIPIVVMISAVVSIFGDLAASAIKRNYVVKDYGNIIPGHGGILDRFDSVIFVAPFVYYLLVMFMMIGRNY
ncbi:MAG: phosphatidate cytidylyltransferase [Eubacterium sp.]|nr:phosphatidate cytidylyltransferase [Eubacterium sp.]